MEMKLMTEIEKLMVSYKDDEIEVMGNRLGLKNFGEICLALSRLGDEEQTTANHFAEFMNNAAYYAAKSHRFSSKSATRSSASCRE
jgi:hypothetical protein